MKYHLFLAFLLITLVLVILRWAGAANCAATAPPLAHIARLLVAITNPKTIAFFTAFLPQFVDPGAAVGRELFVMCTVTVVLAGLTDATWAVAAGLGRATMHCSAGSPASC